MSRTSRPLLLVISGVILLFIALALVPTSPAEAQCGSQASSCKNCHEVQGQDPVNSTGEWHTQHAFGDFCAFCHAGNVQAMEAETAHAGMVEPLADVNAGCAACHPEDALDLGKVYGVALGVEVGSGGGAPRGGAPGGGVEVAAGSPVEAEAPPALIAPEAGVIDFNQRYAETVLGQREVNVGNVILSILIALLILGGGGYIVWRERRARLASRQQTPDHVQHPAPLPGPASAIEGISPEVAALLPMLEAMNPLGRRALARLLEDPATTSDLLYRLSRLDPDLVRQVRGLDVETRALLMGLSGN
jgi:hypothetical protein